MKSFSLRMFSIAALLTAALVMSAQSAQAVLIDSFDQDQGPVTDLFGGAGTLGSNDTVTLGTDLLSPERQIYSEVTGRNGTGNARLSAEVSGGQYNHSQEVGAFGYSTLTYTGFGNANLASNGEFGIALKIIESDLGGSAKFSLTDGTNTTGVYTVNIPQVTFGAPQTLFFLFTNLVPNVNINDITKIVLEIDGRNTANLDVAVDFVATATPEPASLLLIGTGLLGLGWLRRKQKNS